jgi:two-component system nitrate/nitrite response regulator NarL
MKKNRIKGRRFATAMTQTVGSECGGAMTRLVVCDDHRILVESLAVALEARGHDLLAVTTTQEECLTAVASAHPDVCLLDLYLPDREEGLETARAIRANHPDTRVLILSGMADPEVLAEAIDLGVAGIIRKDQTVDKIDAALARVAAEGSAFQTDVVRDVVSRLTAQPRKEPWEYLTERELEVLRRIVAGESTKQMARSMRIAVSTVRTYAQNVLTKLGVHSRLEASAIAVRAQLVDEVPGNAWSPT